MSNMFLRILSSLIIGPLFIISILWVQPLFIILMLFIAIIMLFEWYEMTKLSPPYLLLGLVVIPIPIISLILVSIKYNNRWLLLAYFITIWSVDTFAMIGGKRLKGPKLAPYLSPNKTWSGLITGVIGAGIIMSLVSTIPNFNTTIYYLSNKASLISASMLIAIVAQCSDLFISYFKRKFGIKDSGSFIPGHGGALDRFDSIILTAPILFLAVYYIQFI